MIKLRAVLEMFTKGTDKAQKEVGGINKQLDQAADNAARMNKNLSQTQTGRSRGKVDDTRDYRTQRGITGARGASGRDFAALARAGDGAEGSFVGAYASLAANIFAVTAAFQALSNAARTEQLTKGLELMGARGGVALTLTAKNLQAVTDNAISAADAMKATAQASASGFSGDEIERLGKVARGASLALGRDMADSLDRLTKGAIKLEPELLDELGIMTRLDDAVKVYADANDKAVSSLTQTERRQAFLNAVLDEGERKFSDINDQIATNPFDQLSASVKNTATQIGTLANNVLGPVAKFFAENPFALLAPGIFLISKALQGLGISATVAEGKINNLFDNIVANKKRADIVEDIDLSPRSSSRDLAKFVQTEALTSPDKLKSVDDLKESFRKIEGATEGLTRNLTMADKAMIGMSRTALILQVRLSLMAATIKSIAVTVAVASLQMLAFTALFAGLAVIGAGIGKLIDYFRGLTPEIKESRARMKELAQQANETAKQIRLMLQPGKQQEGQAFDAMIKSAKAAREEILALQAIQKRAKEVGSKPIERTIYTVGGNEALGMADAEQIRTNIGAPGAEINKKTVSLKEEKIFLALETSLKKRLKLSPEQAKLQVGQYKILLATLSAEEYRIELAKTDMDYMLKRTADAGEMNASFAEMQESGKNLSKFTKDLFPKKTVSAATEVANSFKEILVNIEAGPKASQDTRLFNLGLANEIATMGPNIRDNITALEAQGISFEKQAGTLSKIKALEEARGALQEAKLKKDRALEIAALVQLATAQNNLARDKEGVVELLTKFDVEQRILGVLSQINQEKIKQKNLESQIAKQSGDNAKSAAEYAQTIKDSKRLEAGLDLNIPEELTLDYRIKIAQIEQSTAETIARIKKETLRLEAQNQEIQIQSEIGRLKKELEKNKGRLNPSITDARVEEIIRDPNDDRRAQALLELELRGQERLLSLGKELLKLNIAGADSETLRAKGTLITLEAQKKGLNPIKLAAQYALQELDALQEKQNILNANADALSMGAQLSTQVTSLLRASEIPALQQKLTIAEQNRAEQKKFNEDNKNLSTEDLAFNERKLRILTEVESAASEQLNVVNQIVDSATAGLIADSASLDLQDKKLNILRDQANAMKSLKDAQLNLTRAQVEASAKRQGRELSASEQGALKANELKSQIGGIVGLPANFMGPPTKEQAMSEMALLEQEKNLLIEKSKLEEALFTIRFAAAEQELANSIAIAKTQNLDTTKSQAALDKMRSLSVDFASIFADERSAIATNKESERQALQARADALTAELSATASTPEQVGNQILLELGNQLRSVFGGFGLTGQGADSYTSERAGIMSNTELSPDQRKEELKNTKAMSFEIQQQQILAEGLSSIFAGLGDSITNAFVAMIDGSKSAKEAFGEMAQQILRDIVAMITKMLIFKAIEAGLNMIPGVGGFLSTGFRAMTQGAAGGVIPMATGGIMDRSMGLQSVIKQPTYLVGEGRYNEAVVPLPNGRSIPVQMHGGSSQSNNVAVTVNMSNNGSQTQSEGQDPAKLGQAIAAAVQRELVAQKAPGGLLNRYSAI